MHYFVSYYPVGYCKEIPMQLTDHCPVAATLELIGGKYKALILWHLSEGKLRFSEIGRAHV